jgi:hypothetical protein
MTERDWDELEAAIAPPAEYELAAEEPPELESFELDREDGELPPEALDEIEALAEAELEELRRARADLEAERDRSLLILARYREALLAAEPELPPELVRGENLEELDASLESARAAVAEIRARLQAQSSVAGRGFPVGAPARGSASKAGLSAAEKIRRGLEERVRT